MWVSQIRSKRVYEGDGTNKTFLTPNDGVLKIRMSLLYFFILQLHTLLEIEWDENKNKLCSNLVYGLNANNSATNYKFV